MAQVFGGRVWMVATPDEEIEVKATIDDGRLVVVSGPHQILDWAVDDLDVSTRSDGFLIRCEGDEIVFSTPRSGFPQALASQRGP